MEREPLTRSALLWEKPRFSLWHRLRKVAQPCLNSGKAQPICILALRREYF